MSDKQAQRYWAIGAASAGGIVGAVAALLLAIIATARRILSNASQALAVANEIVTSTRPIWELDQTNAVAVQLLEEVRRIEQHVTEVADALDPAPPAPTAPPTI